MKTKKLKMVIYEKPRKRKVWTIADFEKGFFKGPKNLSKNIDKILYGYGRK
jgi:hypothetical protein